MPSESQSNAMGRNPKLTESRVLEIMSNANRPVWSAKKFADRADVTHSTARKHLKELVESGKIETLEVGNATAYYLIGHVAGPIGDGEEPIERDIRRSFEDTFVGDVSSPRRVSTMDGEANAGEKVQLTIEGRPGEWRRARVFGARRFENRREKLSVEETTDHEVQALISGELYEKPTVPVEHVDYPDDYDLKLNIGPHIEETEHGAALIATGVKNYLIRPCDEALFLRNVEVEWISPSEAGQHIPTYVFPDQSETNSKRPPEVQEALDSLKEGEDGNSEEGDYFGGGDPGL